METKKILIGENMKEAKIHGSQNFPFAAYENQLDRIASGFVNWHWNNDIQFCIVTKGKIEFSVELESYILNPGQGIFINSGCIHRARSINYKDAAYICINFSRELISSFPGSIIEEKYISPYLGLQQYPVIILSPHEKKHISILTKLYKTYEINEESESGYELRIISELMLIWKDLISLITPVEYTESIKNQVLPNRTKSIITYIHENYANKITLQEISDLVNICPEECCRTFKEVTGNTIFEYLTDFRIKKSLELLEQTSMNITQISDFVGFSNPSYYIKQFKQINGCTPKVYRNNLKTD